MPIYEYKCLKCGEVFEAFQKISDDPLTRCKFCGGPVEKLISHTTFRLKGSGWYLTDYAHRSSSASDNSGKPDHGPGKAAENKPGAETKTTDKGA